MSLKVYINNGIVLEPVQCCKILNYCLSWRFRWPGHVARMPNDRLPKRLLFGHMNGTAVKLRGRARKKWVDCIGDLQFAEPPCK